MGRTNWIIYVCSVVDINGFMGKMSSNINNGDTLLQESAARIWSRNFDTYRQLRGLGFDFDLDGDLIYTTQSCVHTKQSYRKAELRKKRNAQSGDKLLRNVGGVFVEIVK